MPYALVLFTACVLLLVFYTSCQPNSTDSDKTSLDLKQYLEQIHQDSVLVQSDKLNKNEGNFGQKEYSRSAHYTASKLGPRTAHVEYYKRDTIALIHDSYYQEYVGLQLDQALEQAASGIPFITHTRIAYNNNGQPLMSVSMQALDTIRQRILQQATFHIRYIVYAPDIRQAPQRYRQFHVDVMAQLKSLGIAKADLDLYFIKDDPSLETYRNSVRRSIDQNHWQYINILERWRSIHDNKWYDLVKDHPEKVLKYGRIITAPYEDHL